MVIDGQIGKFQVDNEKNVITFQVTSPRSEDTAAELVRFGSAQLAIDIEFKQPDLYDNGLPGRSEPTLFDQPAAAEPEPITIDQINAEAVALQAELPDDDQALIARHAELMAAAQANEGELAEDAEAELQDIVSALYKHGYTVQNENGKFIWTKRG